MAHPGPLPTATLATTEMVAVSMTETLFEPKLMGWRSHRPVETKTIVLSRALQHVLNQQIPADKSGESVIL